MKQTQVTKKYYDKHAALWTQRKTNSFHHQKQFEQFANRLPKNTSVLDIGCAGGIHVPLFLGIGRHLRYTGIDISNSFLKIARSRYPQLKFLQANILDETSLPKKKFGAFWAGAVLMHIPYADWSRMFTNIEQHMKPDALGYLSLPTVHPSGPRANNDSRHFTIFDAKTQRQELKKRGWTIEKSGTIDGTTEKAAWKWYLVQLP